MTESRTIFSHTHVRQVAQKMHEVSRQYEQLFIDLGTRMFVDMVDAAEAWDVMNICVSHIEKAVLAFDQYFPDPSTIACTKGCHHCCAFPIECPPQVVIDVACHIRAAWSAHDLHQLEQKLEKDIRERKAPLYRALCPFLDYEHNCSIYDRRPLSCRWFSSPDAALCEKSVQDGRNIPQHSIHHRIFQVATTMLLACAKQQGRFHEQVRFIPSLLSVLKIEKGAGQWKGYNI